MIRLWHPFNYFALLLTSVFIISPTFVFAEVKVLNLISYIQLEQDHPPVSSIASTDKNYNWQTADLPFSKPPIGQSKLEDYTTFWFRIPLADLRATAATEDQILSIYIWRHNLRLAIYYDNQRLGGTIKNRADGKPDSGWNHPVMIDIPPLPDSGSDPAGDNLAGNHVSQVPLEVERGKFLYIQLESGPSGAILSPLVIGARSEILPLFEERYFLQIEITRWIFALCSLLSVLSIWLWTQRNQDTLYLRFCGMSVCSAVTSSYFFLDYMPIDVHLWIGIQHAASDWGFYFLISYLLLALNLSLNLFSRMILGTTVLATIVYLVAPEQNLQPIANLIHVLETFIAFGFFLYVFWLTLKAPDATKLWFSFALFGSLIIFSHDIYYVFLSNLDEHVGASNWLQLNPAFIALAFFAHLIHRFVSALDESEALNRTLERRVEDTRLELQKSFDKNRKLDLQRSADDERQKIYRDLHDDLGSKLVSIVHASGSAKESKLARGALESLRESIYRANYPEQSLDGFMTQVSEEAELRITSAGMGFTCWIEPIPDLPLASREGYHLSRILREVISNIIHHSRASDVRFRTNLNAGHLNMEVCDNGIGGVDPGCKSGGLTNIRFRADQMKAQVNWTNNEPGCCFRLSVPMEIQP